MIACIFVLGGLSLGDYLCGVSWCWVFIYFYWEAYYWTPPFFGVFDVIGLHRPDIKISGKFEIIRIDIFILAYALLPISIVDRIETYC